MAQRSQYGTPRKFKKAVRFVNEHLILKPLSELSTSEPEEQPKLGRRGRIRAYKRVKRLEQAQSNNS